MMLGFSGRFVFDRPLTELATVLDMTGLALTATSSAIRSDDTRLRIMSVNRDGPRFTIEGFVHPEVAEAWLARLAVAFDADGIGYRFVLLDASGAPWRAFEGDRDG